MAKDHYFDITAKLDMMELKNALVMAEKEVATRFDFKGLVAEFKLNEDAKTLTDLGVFMGPGFAQNPEKYRREGKHIKYAKTIKANMDTPKVIRRDSRKTESSSKDPKEESFDPFAGVDLTDDSPDAGTAVSGSAKTQKAKTRRKR